MGALVEQLEVGLLANFVTLIRCERTGCVALVDPAFEVDRVLSAARRNGGRVVAILVTHTHIDHIDGVAECARETGAPVYVGAAELAALRDAAPELGDGVRAVSGGERVLVGDVELTALATPGHTVAGVTWVGDGFAVTGDVLFVGSCGRSDLGGDAATLYRSLTEVIAALPEETRLYPGHDYGPTPTSTLGWELVKNPCFAQPDEASFVRWLRQREKSP